MKYESAQVARCEVFVEEIVEIADTELDAATARNRMDARRWYAAKAKPTRYGEKLEVKVEHSIDLAGVLQRAKNRLPSNAPQAIEASNAPRLLNPASKEEE